MKIENLNEIKSFGRKMIFLYHKIAIYSSHKTEFIFITFN